ncbi:MAG: translocation/assembly module TamB domain-containing protein [Chitinophagaceae bacterium]
MTFKKIIRKTGKVLAWIIASILLLVLLVYILIQIPAVQNWGKKKAVAYLEKKLKTKVEIQKFSLSFPKRIVLEGVYLEDQKKDTLLFAEKLQVDISLLKLIKSNVEIKYLELSGVNANITRQGADTVFNFDYIVKAFAGEEKKAKVKDTTGTLKFRLDKLVLSRIHGKFKDDQSGNLADFNIVNFETGFKTFDLDKMIFDLPKIVFNGGNIIIRQYKPLLKPQPMAVVEAQSNEPFKFDLRLQTIDFKNINFLYDNKVSALAADLHLGNFTTEVQQLDLQNLLIRLDKTVLKNTTIGVLMGKSPQAEVVAKEVGKKVAAQVNNPWKIDFSTLDMANNQIQFENDNSPKLGKGFDNSHLDIKGLEIKGSGLSFSPSLMKGNIAQLAFTDRSGLNLKTLQTDFVYSDTGASLTNLLLETDKTHIKNRIAISYDSIGSLTKRPGDMYVNALLTQSSVAVKDIILFMPSLASRPPFAGNEQAVLKIDGAVKGYLNNLNVASLQLSGIGNTSIALSGNIKGLPDPNKTVFNVSISQFRATKKDLLQFIPTGALPDNIRLPESISGRGILKGSMENLFTDMKLQTSSGNIDIAGTFDLKHEAYDATAVLRQVDAGYLLKQEKILGRVSMNITAKGNGFDMKKASSVIKAKVQSAFVNGYTYTNLDLKADLRKGNLLANAVMNDRNIAFDMEATADLTKANPSVQLQMKIDTLNLYALKLMGKKYSIRGNINADLAVANPDSLVGKISINNLVFIDSGKIYKADTLVLTAAANGAQRNIAIQSEALQLRLDGKYRLTEIATALQKTINRYYTLEGFKETSFTPQEWTLYAKLIPSPMLYELLPQLKGSDSITLNMLFNSQQNKLDLVARAPKIVFGTQAIDSLTLTANANGNALAYAATINGAGSKGFYVYKTAVTGDLANNMLNTNVDIKDIKGQSKYQLGAMIKQVPGGARLSFKPDLMLNFEKWVVANNNFIQYDNAGILANNFVISNQSQSLSINSTGATASSPLEVKFDNFNISTLTSIAGQKDLVLGGTINGKADVDNVTVNPVFTSDLTIANLSYKSDTVGNVLVKVNNKTANAYDADVRIEGNGNDVQLNGRYYTGVGKMDLKLDIVNLNLATIKKFSAGQLADASGSLKGNIAFKGTLKAPSVIGDVRFEKAYITPTMLGERFLLSNESITVATRDIIFDRFTIADSSGNTAVIDGNIYTNDFTDFRFDMDVTARNFRAINVAKKRGDLFYGKLNVDADVRIRGTVDAPVVKADIKANRETNITMVLPSDDPEVQSRDGVVRFIDFQAPVDSSALLATIDSLIISELKGIDLVANIETDTAAQFTMVIDELSGDELKIKGKADLATSIDRSGKLSLTGSYEVQGGSYQLSFSVLKRKFDIQKGSIITWTGDPTTANIDITAVYVINTAPIDLVQSQVQGQADVNRYKQKIPFDVYLKMSGELLKPVITFDIALQADKVSQWKDIDTKLEQVRRDDAEMNKQVFALLLLGRFVAENPFQSEGAGVSAAGLVRQSASRILSEQLNQLAGNLIKGVDLNFGVSSEDVYNENTGQLASRTDVNVAISKRLLGDRLRVTVGSNFEIEGPKSQNQNASNIAGDVALDYQLTKDGRYLLRAYRKNKYEGVVEGQIVETGISFIFTLEYDQFQELFNKAARAQRKKTNEANKELEKEQKAAEKAATEKRAAELDKKEKVDSLPSPVPQNKPSHQY